jgi:hypothetical protein
MPLVHFTFRPTDIPADAHNVRGSVMDQQRNERDKDYKDTGRVIYGPFPIWTWETHVGVCLSERERNMRDDSDFYMLIWDEAENLPKEICFASTRGWTYPCLGSRVDATEEVRAKYVAWSEARAQEARKRQEERRANTPDKGKRVRVVKSSKNVTKGTEGEVFWFGKAQTFGPSYRQYRSKWSNAGLAAELHAAYGDPREGMRVGLRLADGSKVFCAATLVEVIRD